MAVSPTISGSMLTPFSTLLAFIGIPIGFLLARTKKYRWMYTIGYAVVTLVEQDITTINTCISECMVDSYDPIVGCWNGTRSSTVRGVS
jgi:hypothetical protein